MKIGILGAGLMGRLMALHLARAGHGVSLCDAAGPEGENGAARVAAAMLAPLAESVITEPNVVHMGFYGLQRWPELLRGLEPEVFFQRAGTLILWHRQDSAQAHVFQQRLEQSVRLLRPTHGLDLVEPVQLLQGSALKALEPTLEERFAHGLFLPSEGQLDNRGLLNALLRALDTHQVPVHWNTPFEIEHFKAQHPTLDWVVDARGLGAKPALPHLRGVRGEVLRVQAPDVTLSRPTRLLHPRYPIYIAPKPEGVFVIGATEIESEDLSPPSLRSSMELMSAAYAVHPGFGEARILEMNTQARPTLSNNLPLMREISPGVLVINGLYRHGYLIAPALVDAATEWMVQGQQTLAQQWQLVS